MIARLIAVVRTDGRQKLTNGPTVIIAIAAVIVAALGALIAYFQFITAGRKLMLDLFDQRLKVVEGIERALA
jgi:hypothetical protein